MTTENLQTSMLSLLSAFNKNQSEPVTPDSVHGKFLTNDRGSAIYKTAVLFVVKTASPKKTHFRFPGNWLDISVKDLADTLVAQATK